MVYEAEKNCRRCRSAANRIRCSGVSVREKYTVGESLFRRYPVTGWRAALRLQNGDRRLEYCCSDLEMPRGGVWSRRFGVGPYARRAHCLARLCKCCQCVIERFAETGCRVYVRKCQPIFLRYSRMDIEAAAPSPTAEATCLVLP